MKYVGSGWIGSSWLGKRGTSDGAAVVVGTELDVGGSDSGWFDGVNVGSLLLGFCDGTSDGMFDGSVECRLEGDSLGSNEGAVLVYSVGGVDGI